MDYKGPWIAHLDIETAPNIGTFWRSGNKVFITPDNIIQERYVLGFSYIWEHEPDDKVKHHFIHNYPKTFAANVADDSEVIKEVYNVLHKADIVVTYNGDRFDLPWLNGRMFALGLNPPSNYKCVDLYKTVRKKFNLNSMKLGYVNKMIGYRGKDDMCFNDWLECMKGNVIILEKMAQYCDRDVLATRELYRKLRGWITNHPNLAVYSENPNMCGACGKEHTMIKYGSYVTTRGKRQRYYCTSCGHTQSGAENLLSKETRKELKGNVANG